MVRHQMIESIQGNVYPVVVAPGGPDTVVGRLEEAVSPPLQAITNVDCDAPLNGVNGGPVLGSWHCIPDVANLLQVWVLINVLARGYLQSHITCRTTLMTSPMTHIARQMLY